MNVLTPCVIRAQEVCLRSTNGDYPPTQIEHASYVMNRIGQRILGTYCGDTSDIFDPGHL